MSIFGKLILEPTVQEDDKTRLNATKSFVSKDEADITLVEIEPEASAGFIDVTGTSSNDWFLDWEYSTDGDKTVSLRLTTDGGPVVFTEDIEVVTEADDKLFSNDDDLKRHEPSVLNWIISGRNTFKDMHRRAQTLILDFFRIQGYRNQDGTNVSKDEILDILEVKEWSTYMVLKLVFEGRSNDPEDIFREKSRTYNSEMIAARESVFKVYDFNKDGDLTASEQNKRFNVINVEKT